MHGYVAKRSILILVCMFGSLMAADAVSHPSMNYRITTISGAPVDEIFLNLGDIFSGERINMTSMLGYRVRGDSEDSMVTIDSGSCFVNGGKISNFEVKIEGSSVALVRQLPTQGFMIQVTSNLNEHLEGALICSGGAIREVTTSQVLARLEIGGFVRRVPKWANRWGAKIHQVSFSFDSRMAGQVPDASVDSSPIDIRLLNALNYPATTIFHAPSGCSIGGTHLSFADVGLKVDGAEIHDGGIWSVSGPQVLRVVLRIFERAKMGTKSGRVSCNSPGSLTYTW